MELLLIAGIDLTHLRLVDLANLADRAKPFYDWVEKQFRLRTGQQESRHLLLSTLNSQAIRENIAFCYKPNSLVDLPRLFDGVGRTYPHTKANTLANFDGYRREEHYSTNCAASMTLKTNSLRSA